AKRVMADGDSKSDAIREVPGTSRIGEWSDNRRLSVREVSGDSGRVIMRVVLAVALLLGWVEIAAAQKRPVRVVWLPTRAQNAMTRGEVDRIATEIADAVAGE